MTFETVLDDLRTVAPDDFRAIKTIQENWKSLIQQDKANLERLYDIYFATIEGLLGRSSAASLSGIQAYNFIGALSALTPVSGHGAKDLAWRLLTERHRHHLDLIREAMTRPNHVLSDTHLRTRTGHWADIVTAMLDLYYWHRPYGERDDSMAIEAAAFVPGIYRAFPDHSSTLLDAHLMLHPNAVAEAGEIVEFYITQNLRRKTTLLANLSSTMFGFYSDKNDKAYVQSTAIVQHALRNVKTWTGEQVEQFLEEVILTPLSIETVSQTQAAAVERSSIENYERLLRENRYEGHLGISAETERQRDADTLEKHRKTLELIETDFQAWIAQRRKKAIQRLAVSATTRKAFKLAKSSLPAPQSDVIAALLNEATAYAARPKLYPLPKPSENRFKDFGLKLLVIEELMYRQKRLTPQFDVHAFAKEYDKREISVEVDGYEIIPEVETYFKNLPIADDLLAEVETLHQSSGLDGGSSFIYHLYPFWDPGSGDQPIPLGNKAIDDLSLLPNLKSISGLENSEPSSKLVKALTERGIATPREDAV